MIIQPIKINFLSPAYKKRLFRASIIHLTVLVIINMSLAGAGLFLFTNPASAYCTCCYGNITITKNTNGLQSPDFNFSVNSQLVNDFSLAGGESKNFGQVPGGVYVITEEEQVNWRLTDIQCTYSGNYNKQPIINIFVEDRQVEIHLTDQAEVNCVFTNEPLPPEPGTITIVKDAEPDSDQEFNFSGDLGEFSLVDNGDSNTNSRTFVGLEPRSYYVTEEEIEGWKLTNVECEGGSYDPAGNGIYINLGAGENITCTFTNEKQAPPVGTLIVKKIVAGGEATSSDWTIQVSSGDSFLGSLAGEVLTLEPGMYEVSESGGPENYELTYSGDCGETGLVSVTAGATSTCILTNTYNPPQPPQGEITVCKYYDNGEIGQYEPIVDTPLEWTVGLTLPNQTVMASTTDAVTGCATFIDLDLGHYIVSENHPGGNWVNSLPGDNGVYEIDLTAATSSRTVIFLNYKETSPPPKGSITVCKYIDEDGLASTSDDRYMSTTTDWTFVLNNGTATTSLTSENGCAVFENLPLGDYIVTEVEQEGWRALSATSTEITLTACQPHKNIAFLNYHLEEPKGSITVCKYIDEDNLASTTEDRHLSTTTDWIFALDNGVATTSQITKEGCTVFNELPAGNYTISEEIKNNWIALEPADGQINIELPAGEERIVNFINYYREPPAPYCGDGHLDPGEQCDDGNNVNGDGCSASCRTEGGGGGGGGYCFHCFQHKEQPSETPGQPQLVINKSIARPAANPDDENILYTIVITNNGLATATDVVLTDELPTGLVYADFDGGQTREWQLGDLAPGKIIAINYLVNVSADASAGTYTNTAQTEATNHPPVFDTAALEVRKIIVKAAEMTEPTLPETGFSLKEFVSLLIVLFACGFSALRLRRKYKKI
jgi:uncharacterized repeat protein (TIGR01451 family)